MEEYKYCHQLLAKKAKEFSPVDLIFLVMRCSLRIGGWGGELTRPDRSSCVLIGERTKMYGNWLTDSPTERWMLLGRSLIGLLYGIRSSVTCSAPWVVIGSPRDILCSGGLWWFHSVIAELVSYKCCHS